MIKRVLDVVGAATAIAVLSPVLISAAAAVALLDGLPIFFRQERVGLGGRRFAILKFRTMRPAAPGDPRITVAADSRVTAIGRFLRRYELDELPTLFNVIKGDMSLVGPRPELPVFVERFAADYRTILRVRPGITDEASLMFRDEAGLLAGAADPERVYESEILPHKLHLAASYVRTRTLWGDCRLLVRTAAAVIRKRRRYV